MSWKQPIPTDLDEVFGKDYLCRDLYIRLLLRSANQDGFFTDEKTNRTIPIKRGQVVFGQIEWSKQLRTSPATIWRALQKLEKMYQKVNNSPDKGFTVVSIINYDEITKMNDTRMTGELLVNTSKSVKNNKEKKIKKKRKPQGVLSGSLPPLDYPHIYQIAQEMMVTIDDVRQIDKEVRLSVETGNKYNLTNQVNAVRLWVNNALKRGEMQVRNEVEDMIFSHQSPEELAHDEVITEQLKVKYPNLI